MRWFRKIDDLPEALKQEILHNSRDMNRFYALTTEERQNVLNRIGLFNSPEELEQASKRK